MDPKEQTSSDLRNVHYFVGNGIPLDKRYGGWNNPEYHRHVVDQKGDEWRGKKTPNRTFASSVIGDRRALPSTQLRKANP